MVNVYKLFTNWGGYFSGFGGDAGFLCGGGRWASPSLLGLGWGMWGCSHGAVCGFGEGGFPFSLGIGLGVAFLHLPAILGGFSLCT